MSTTPYELLVRFNPDGTVSGVSVRTLTTVNGRAFESDPQPLAGTKDPAFTAFAEQFSAGVVAERDEALADLAASRAELAPLTTERDALRAEVERLNAELEALRNPTDSRGFPILYPSQLRRQLRRSGISLATVAAVIAAIPDEVMRGDAADLWEYSTTFERSNPLIDLLGGAMGLTTEQIDTLWRTAATL
jgi:hypothetical protein